MRAGEEDDDDAQEKATAWDDWKDDNPRSAGNKKFTLCGKNAAADCFRSVMYRIEIRQGSWLEGMEIMYRFQERNAKAHGLSPLSWCRDNRNMRAGEEDDADAQEKATA
ncbi:hypothetical protein RHSIM_Rhsim03G0259700 [Rhododendron simsii]|uniref:Uncharacterized protein n=1 Tax=Rhododendron simsii TaxID=118357 RepID=A0A834LWC1_RHOSS|nr:hypothetical protein RHSIM_Rhsim03G0259700 [Rhododendron simsii]